MLLLLRPYVINGHIQKYPESCIPMSVEFLVKLVDPTQLNFYDEQDKFPKGPPNGGNYYDGKIINNLEFKHQFNINRGRNFPLNNLFKTIKDEIDQSRYVQLSLESYVDKDVNGKITFRGHHCWVVYGYDSSDNFLGVSRLHGQNQPIFKSTIKQEIISMGGTDIITYRVI
jgi:hypothetical protein